jgi:hypothetical protein
MTLLRRRQASALILMIVVVYTATFLLHDLAWGPLPVAAQANGLTVFDTPGPESPDGRDQGLRPGETRHQCPFCSGFTGSIYVTPLPPPAEIGCRAAGPAVRPVSGAPALSTFARAPPFA